LKDVPKLASRLISEECSQDNMGKTQAVGKPEGPEVAQELLQCEGKRWQVAMKEMPENPLLSASQLQEADSACSSGSLLEVKNLQRCKDEQPEVMQGESPLQNDEQLEGTPERCLQHAGEHLEVVGKSPSLEMANELSKQRHSPSYDTKKGWLEELGELDDRFQAVERARRANELMEGTPEADDESERLAQMNSASAQAPCSPGVFSSFTRDSASPEPALRVPDTTPGGQSDFNEAPDPRKEEMLREVAKQLQAVAVGKGHHLAEQPQQWMSLADASRAGIAVDRAASTGRRRAPSAKDRDQQRHERGRSRSNGLLSLVASKTSKKQVLCIALFGACSLCAAAVELAWRLGPDPEWFA